VKTNSDAFTSDPGAPAFSRLTPPGESARAPSRSAFTLIEMLVVIAIIGILAAIAAPVLHNFRPNYTASVTQALLTDLARARQLAISQHTTVYMVFVPTNFWKDPAYGVGWTAADRNQATNLIDKQLIGYNFVSIRSMGDQPGRPTVHYLSSWKSLPEGGYIFPAKFLPTQVGNPPPPVMRIFTNGPSGQSLAFNVYPFDYANTTSPGSPVIPFPLENTVKGGVRSSYVRLPYIAFDYMGRLASNQGGGQGAVLPITRGSAIFAHDANKRPTLGLPSFSEQPVGNTTNGYNLVYVDRITGRARSFQQEVR
jgi:prepilin-type N-terminal cleavage/methylation domain-containing protein